MGDDTRNCHGHCRLVGNGERLTVFLERAGKIELVGANFWSWDYARSHGHTALWNAVAAFTWPP